MCIQARGASSMLHQQPWGMVLLLDTQSMATLSAAISSYKSSRHSAIACALGAQQHNHKQSNIHGWRALSLHVQTDKPAARPCSGMKTLMQPAMASSSVVVKAEDPSHRRNFAPKAHFHSAVTTKPVATAAGVAVPLQPGILKRAYRLEQRRVMPPCRQPYGRATRADAWCQQVLRQAIMNETAAMQSVK